MGKKIMIFDIGISGHHSEYIRYLIDYLTNEKSEDLDYYFVLHPAFSKTFPEIHDKGNQIKNVHWKPIEEAELGKIQNSLKILSPWVQFRIMDCYAKRYSTNHVCTLHFHTIKYGGIFHRSSYTISSILFLQFYRLKKTTLKEKLEYYKRYYLTKWCSRNKRIRTIFVYNDNQSVTYMNNEFNTECFKILPDPIPKLEPLEDFDIYTHYNIDKKRKIFLHIGSLGDRKGTPEVIEAAGHIARRNQEKVAILLVGKASGDNAEQVFLEKIETAKNTTNVHVYWDNQFVSTKMMKSLFDQCDAVLLPYKNAEFSSGILGHAAAAQKTVIATGAGLIKELVLKYNLGELLDRPDAPNIAQKISGLLNSTIPESKGKMDFVNLHSSEIFAEKILNE